MHAFYLKALLRLALLLAASAVVAYLCVERSYHRAALHESSAAPFSWLTYARSQDSEGAPAPKAAFDARRLGLDYLLPETSARPFAAASVMFTDGVGKPVLLDWSRYEKISFQARCFPANTLVLAVATFDEQRSKLGDLMTHRSPTAYLDCDETGSRIELDLTKLEMPQWWLALFKVNTADRGYSHAKVAQIEFGTSERSPKGVPSRFEISGIELHDRQYGYLYLLGLFLVLAWGGFGLWFFRRYGEALADELQARMQRHQPLAAYQQLSFEPHRDREKAVILKLLATRYADPELDLDAVISQSGINRNKINDILRAEMGYTFTGYLNKLRLTEAARLLSEQSSASIAEIAYSVGYKNPSYFNKLFKEEYNCTPKAFREVCKRKREAA